MSDSASQLAPTDVSEAADAFQAALDAETPSRSRKDPAERRPSKTEIEDLFPNKQMDRREAEGGANEPPPRPVSDDPEADEDEDASAEEYDDEEAPDEGPPEEEYDDEESPSEIDPNQIVRVMVDGQPMEVSVDEMAKGYIRQETFHRRMSELDQGIRAYHQARAQHEQDLALYATQAQELEEYVQAFLPKEPDWRALFEADAKNGTNHASQLRFEWEQMVGKISGLHQNRVYAQQVLQQRERERISDFVQANRLKLSQDRPEWRNEKVWRRDSDSMRRTALNAGFSPQEIATLYDARMVTVLDKAAKWDRMNAAKPKPVRQQASTRPNGVTPSRNMSRSFDRAERRQNRGSSKDQLVAAFERDLSREG